MADAGASDSDILERLREQAGAFQSQTDFSDVRVNDGTHYAGLMQAADYKQRRLEVLEDPNAKKMEQVAAARNADREARAREAASRDEREAQRKEKLRRQLAEADKEEAAEAAEAAGDKKKKKRKKKGVGEEGALSFDADE